MIVETKTKSILGITSKLYLGPYTEDSGIKDNPRLKELEFYPAGFTHISKFNKTPFGQRQSVYSHIWMIAVNLRTENRLYPFKESELSITLKPDPTNVFDKNAIHVMLHANPNGVLQKFKDPIDLGFVPMKISKAMAPNLDMFVKGDILQVKNKVHDKFYTAKIIISYGEKIGERNDFNRFTTILED